jgi:two-component system OmpR family sensor kinase
VVAVTGSDGRVAFAALSLRGAAETLGQLLRIEVVAALLVLAGVAFAAFIIVRLGLRPLTRIEHTAGAIAEGELGRRVSPVDSRTEVGRLGLALNAMLDRIETAFLARETSEARLRRFVADASHELRTPLAGIRGYAELYRRGARERPSDLERVMRGIETEAERMGRLVDELLFLARLDNGQQLVQEPVELTQLALEAVDRARVVEPARQVSLKAERPVWVIGDEGRLRQALDNLLSNVRVHTPTPAQVRVTVHAQGGMAVLEVADAGPGMSAEQREHAFERFYRGEASRSRDRGGSGLGLSIVSAIVAAHGGQTSIESTDGGGTRVRLELPTAAPVVGG